MTTSRIERAPKLTKHLIDDGCLTDDFFLVDVGASGGIDSFWKIFGHHLRAVGFDPLVNEVNRLNDLEEDPQVRYESACVGWKHLAQSLPPSKHGDPASDLFRRSSAFGAIELMKLDFVKEQFNGGNELRFSDREVDLDDYFRSDEYDEIDFLKIDTDGHDFPVLLGANQLLNEGGVLGISIESQLHGVHHEYANVFHNIDRFLTGLGFSLFDIEVHRYSRTRLPQPFLLDIPAQTDNGQVFWGEAVYFRDLAQDDYASRWGFGLSGQKLLKLAMLYEMFGLADCAVELLLARRDQFPHLAATKYLNLLTPALPDGQRITYAQYVERFRKNVASFFPGDRERRSSRGGWQRVLKRFGKRTRDLFRRSAA